MLGDPAAAGHLRQALSSAGHPKQRALVACDLADLLGSRGDWQERMLVLCEAQAAVGNSSSEIALHLERRLAGLEAFDTRYTHRYAHRQGYREELCKRSYPHCGPLRALMAAVAAWQGSQPEAALDLCQQALAGWRLLELESSAGPSVPQALSALVLIDRLDLAEDLVKEMLSDAERRHSARGHTQALACRAWVSVQRGDLGSAETDIECVAQVCQESEDFLGLVCTLRCGLDALVERPVLAPLRKLAAELEVKPTWSFTLTAASAMEARSVLLQDGADPAKAEQCLRQAGQIYQALGFANSIWPIWRLQLATLVDPHEGRQLLDEELRAAAQSGQPRAWARALRLAGRLGPARRRLGYLQEACAWAAKCPSDLELAHCLVDYGAALRRQGQRVQARAFLAEGWRKAEACGAQALAVRASDELHLAGGRRRRSAGSHIQALTLAEERVARLAAQRLTNKEIAAALYVTPKTVENQLGSVYRKLGVAGRRQLATSMSLIGEHADGSPL